MVHYGKQVTSHFISYNYCISFQILITYMYGIPAIVRLKLRLELLHVKQAFKHFYPRQPEIHYSSTANSWYWLPPVAPLQYFSSSWSYSVPGNPTPPAWTGWSWLLSVKRIMGPCRRSQSIGFWIFSFGNYLEGPPSHPPLHIDSMLTWSILSRSTIVTSNCVDDFLRGFPS